MAISALSDKLSKVSICRGLSAAETHELAAIAEQTQAAKGSTLFKEGDHGDAMFIILEGQVEITKGGQSLATMGDGSVLGEMALVGGDVRSASAAALTDVQLLKVPQARFAALLKSDQVAALKVVSNLAQVMSKRLSQVNEKLVQSLGKGARKEELADFQRILSNWTF